MMDGEAHYASPRYHGHQQALRAPASGLYLPEPDFEFQKPMRAGDRIATIHDLWGEPLAELSAPVDGLVFGLRALPNVTVGDWCCFYGIVEGTIPD
jgi:predicted deacylase